MKLGLHAYQLGKNWDIDTIIKNCVDTGMASYEFFTHPDYLEPMDLDTPKDKRAEVKEKFEQAGIAIAGLAIVERYDWLEEDKVNAAIDKTKEYVLMAEEMGIPRLRCLGDQLHDRFGSECRASRQPRSQHL